LILFIPFHIVYKYLFLSSILPHRTTIGIKTGCHLEERQVQSAKRLIRRFGLVVGTSSPFTATAGACSSRPERPAYEVLDANLLAVVAAQANQAPALMTTGTFWKAVAHMGGYVARQGDGPPGWKTLWKGWLRVQTLLEGVHLASHLRL